MKSKFLLFVMLLMVMLPVAAWADDVNSDQRQNQSVSQQLTSAVANMDDAQKAEVLKNIQNPAASPAAQKAKEWVEVGSGIGESLAATAGKLGIEVNKFATTPVGRMAMVLIIWNYMGDDLSGYICGLLWALVMFPIWTKYFKRTFGVYNEKGKFVKINSEMFSDRSTYGIVAWVYIWGFVLISLVFLVFIA